MKRGAIPAEGIVGEAALREAAATEFGQVAWLVRAAIYNADPTIYDICALYPDKAIVSRSDGRQYAYPYTIDDNNQVMLGQAFEVVSQHVAASTGKLVEAAPNNTTTTTTAAGSGGGGDRTSGATALQGEVFIEAMKPAADGAKPSRYLVRVIRAGTSLNKVNYPASVLREAAPLFNGVRVFVKSDAEHLKGGGKDVRQLVGRLTDAKFVEANGGEIQAVLDVLDASPVAEMLRESVQRDMTDLFGLSIDASGKSKTNGKFREAISLTKVDSVDLIIEPGAGGQVIRFAEAHNTEDNTMLRQQMINDIKARDPKRAEGLADASDESVLAAYREAVAQPAEKQGTSDGVTREELLQHTRMVEARADARVQIAQSNLPDVVKDRLTQRFAEAASFTVEDVGNAIKGEREFLAKLNDGAKVRGLGSFVESVEDRSEKVQKMLDDFFDPAKPAFSFRECYREITGDVGVTGRMANVDMQRLREAAGANFREAVDSTTFGNILGDSITRAMIREYANLESYKDWRWMCDIVPVSDFREQQRTRLGGYGNLPAVAENGAYNQLATPTDEKATYTLSKRGGTETISMETIANDDVGLLRRIPLSLATAAGRTLYEFVYGFLDSNALIYDGLALFVAGHNNLGTAALDATSFAAARLRMKQQTEQDSGKRLGITLRHLVIPSDLEETAYNLFQRGTNNDQTFVQSRVPTVHVVDHWTDANNWYAAADNSQVPLIELGFYGGNQDPELFVQDMPTQGSLFSNDQIKYKIRHIYSGAVRDYRAFDGSIVA
ncbi:MAG: phage major capsid protein [Dyella sp.]|uniref:phage major capsid protein n=1 Tax=Dyella sp. TaxID=1869338 RepID=UPI003F7EE8DF